MNAALISLQVFIYFTTFDFLNISKMWLGMAVVNPKIKLKMKKTKKKKQQINRKIV